MASPRRPRPSLSNNVGFQTSSVLRPPPVYGNNYPRPRSPSPLRSSFRVDLNTGEIESKGGSDDNNDGFPDVTWGRCPHDHSPNPSISHFATSFAQRVGSFVSNVLTQEAEEHRLMEEKVLAMLDISTTTPKHISPGRSQSMPPMENPSPTPSQRDSAVFSWWNAATHASRPRKSHSPPHNESFRKPRKKKNAKRRKPRSLITPPKASPKDASLSAPPSPTPGAQGLPSSLPPSLAQSPLRPHSHNASPSRSLSREPPQLYTQFTDQGSLDVPGTLLVIARRFEKLENRTVGHVREFEERMSDVERRLVEKENEKGGDGGEGTSKVNESSSLEGTVNEMQDELMVMQGRIGELGREMT
ncbi:hypothetical protein F5888DRAFT_1631802 [Russula emetica]|nr:hypothetical protein F5888DRAFT_1631802 [Russula emetica]